MNVIIGGPIQPDSSLLSYERWEKGSYWGMDDSGESSTEAFYSFFHLREVNVQVLGFFFKLMKGRSLITHHYRFHSLALDSNRVIHHRRIPSTSSPSVINTHTVVSSNCE